MSNHLRAVWDQYAVLVVRVRWASASSIRRLDKSQDFQSKKEIPDAIVVETDGVSYDVTEHVVDLLRQCAEASKNAMPPVKRVSKTEVYVVNEDSCPEDKPLVKVKVEVSIEGVAKTKP